MNLSRCVLRLFLLLAAVLLPDRLAQAQKVHELPTRLYLLPRTQHRYDSAHQERVTLRCWLLRYTERYYVNDANNGTWYLERKDRASWFFGRVTRQVLYLEDKTAKRVYRYRRNLTGKHRRLTWTAGAEYLVAERLFRDGKLRKVKRYRDGYYLVKQRLLQGKMSEFSNAYYDTGPP